MGYPICLVEIHGEEETWELGIDQTTAKPFGNSPTGELISCRTDKRISPEAPAGTFDLQLVYNPDWFDRVRPQDVVVIQMMNYQGKTGNNGAGEMHTVMIGFVDAITEKTALTSRGTPQRRIQIRGRDAGKQFIGGMTTYFSFVGASMLKALELPDATGKEFINPTYFNDKPQVVIRRLLEDLFQKFLQIKFTVQGQDKEFWDMLAYDLLSYGQEIPAGLDHQFLGAEGSFWSFFTKTASLPFHELWVDTARASNQASSTISSPSAETLVEGNKNETKDNVFRLGRDRSAPTLFLRPTPFPFLDLEERVNSTLWSSLGDEGQMHIVGKADVIGEPFDQTLSKSDQEQFNVFLVFSQYTGLNRNIYLLNVPPVVDKPKFRRYGYRPMMPTSTMLNDPDAPGPGATRNQWIGFYSALAWRLASWNTFNDEFISGTKTFKLQPHIHVGTRLEDRSSWQRKPVRYYVEGVSHNFVQFERATTTLGLTRGTTLTDGEYSAKLTQLVKDKKLRTLEGAQKLNEFWRDLLHKGQLETATGVV